MKTVDAKTFARCVAELHKDIELDEDWWNIRKDLIRWIASEQGDGSEELQELLWEYLQALRDL